MPVRRLPMAAVVACVIAATAVGCSSDASSPIAPTAPTVSQRSTSPSSTGVSAITGMPGIDHPDAMCRGWSRVQATLYLLQIASGFGGLDGVALARLELVAAPSVVTDTDFVASSWPAELDGERTAATSAYLAPLSTRAHAGITALTAAGIDAAGQTSLATAWSTALAAYDPNGGPVIAPAVDPAMAAKLHAASVSFAASRPALADDRTLDVAPDAAAVIPATLAYVDDRCPDLSSIGFGDT